jgi:hypothetical protein
MGDDTPTPLSRVFHAMFWVSLHDSGSRVSLDAPVPAGPRHCGQFSADIAGQSVTEIAIAPSSDARIVARFISPPLTSKLMC